MDFSSGLNFHPQRFSHVLFKQICVMFVCNKVHALKIKVMLVVFDEEAVKKHVFP